MLSKKALGAYWHKQSFYSETSFTHIYELTCNNVPIHTCKEV